MQHLKAVKGEQKLTPPLMNKYKLEKNDIGDDINGLLNSLQGILGKHKVIKEKIPLSSCLFSASPHEMDLNETIKFVFIQ